MRSESGWKELYALALLETDWSKLDERIRVAESAIDKRWDWLILKHADTRTRWSGECIAWLGLSARRTCSVASEECLSKEEFESESFGDWPVIASNLAVARYISAGPDDCRAICDDGRSTSADEQSLIGPTQRRRRSA